MKRQVYSCDHCQTEFGDKEHLRITNLCLYVSKTREGVYDKNKLRWESEQKHHGGEMHFCTTTCFKEWMDKKVI